MLVPLRLHSQVADVLLNWQLTTGNLPSNMIIDKAVNDNRSMVSIDDNGFLNSILDPMGNRNEFEWYKEAGKFYKHYTGGELWVGFRLKVPNNANAQNTCFFQIGPIRDHFDQLRAAGYYQLTLTRALNDPTDPPVWKWREFSGRAPLINPNPARPAPLANTNRINNPALNPNTQLDDLGYTSPLKLYDLEGSAQVARDQYVSSDIDTWVMQLKMRANDSAVVRVWRNGEKVMDSKTDGRALPSSTEKQGNALMHGADYADYTRVKWGPYLGETPLGGSTAIHAQYADIRVAEGGGDDGYRMVAPPDKIFTGIQNTIFREYTQHPILNSRNTVVTGLPYGWKYFREGSKKIEGTYTALCAGARILITYLDAKNRPLKREVWALAGDAKGDTADLDNDGISNIHEEALGSQKNSTFSRPCASVGLTPDRLRLQITFVRNRADFDYVVEAASNLSATTVWSQIAINPGMVGESVTVPDVQELSASEGNRRYLRVRIAQP